MSGGWGSGPTAWDLPSGVVGQEQIEDAHPDRRSEPNNSVTLLEPVLSTMAPMPSPQGTRRGHHAPDRCRAGR